VSFAHHLRRHAFVALQPFPVDPLERREPQFIRDELPLFERYFEAWHKAEVMGLEHLPPGASLVVGNHNGGTLAPDMFALMAAYWRRFGVYRPAYGLAHDLVFTVPGVRQWMSKLGAVPARPEFALELLRRGSVVLVFPGGDVDAYKSWSDRHLVKFGGRCGFIRVALRAQVPIVPAVAIGAHESTVVLSDGKNLAEKLGAKRVRLDVMPVSLGFPWGLIVGPVNPFVPFPTRIRIRLLPAIDLGLPPSAADDDALVRDLAERVRETMQHALDELVTEGGFGLLGRLDLWRESMATRDRRG
jgi:1-acyl-sn-glycerol-3-phosphate acyltransferase